MAGEERDRTGCKEEQDLHLFIMGVVGRLSESEVVYYSVSQVSQHLLDGLGRRLVQTLVHLLLALTEQVEEEGGALSVDLQSIVINEAESIVPS